MGTCEAPARELMSQIDALSPKKRELFNLIISRHARSVRRAEIQEEYGTIAGVVRETADMVGRLADSEIDEIREEYLPQVYVFEPPSRTYSHHYQGWEDSDLLQERTTCPRCQKSRGKNGFRGGVCWVCYRSKREKTVAA